MDILSLLQGIIPTQGSNPGLPHCRQILYQLSHKGLEWVGLSFPGDLPHPGIEPTSPVTPALTGGFFNTEPAEKPMGKNWRS